MNPAQIGAYAYAQGIRSQSDLQAAIAIALAESSGNPNAVGDVRLQNGTWGPSVGLWQIRSLRAETGKGTARDVNKLKDPTFNARSMYQISNGGKNWRQWTTWPLKAQAFMPVAIPAASAVIAGMGLDSLRQGAESVAEGAVGDVADAVTPDGLQDVAEGVRASQRWIADRNNWFRVAKVAVGGVLVVGGAFLIAKPLVTGVAASEVGKVVGKVTKGGK